ncbi:MAG: FAD-binding protein, partial [Actinomycetota bacterium]|nr:FAD-binding protein [Actinomycetota bacterium]
PEVAAAGLAAAARSGARLADLEFVQFHPTSLAGEIDPLPLLTEALRGEGAVLLNAAGDRFMSTQHPDAELAPRDVVARVIWSQLEAGGEVCLDATAAVGSAFPKRFPTVWAHARAAGIDPRIQPIPVTPAEHFHMGGVATDVNGRTSLPGLWAVGEVASTGLHGANRLASNSLLEGLVVGARVARSIDRRAPTAAPNTATVPRSALGVPRSRAPSETISTRELMWRSVGIVRNRSGLEEAIRRLSVGTPARNLLDRDLRLVGRLIAEAALVRKESRGGHYRSDYPDPDPTLAHRSFTTPDRLSCSQIPIRRWSAA